MSNEVAIKEEGALAIVPSVEDAGVGFEGMGAEDFALPYIKLIQQLSPELNPQAEEYNPLARPGLFVNSATQRIYGEAIDVVVAAYARKFNVWRPKALGGGLVTSQPALPAGVQTRKDFNGRERLVIGDNTVEETFYYYLLVGPAADQPIETDEGTDVPQPGENITDRGVYSFKGTGIQVAKKFNMTMDAQKFRVDGKLLTKAIFSNVYRFRTNMRSNAQGSWFAVLIQRQFELSPASDLYQAAKSFGRVALRSRVRGEEPEATETQKTTF